MSEQSLRALMSQRATTGRLTWIGIRPARGEAMVELREGELLGSHGLAGDFTTRGRGGGKRQVTIMQAEHFAVIAALAQRDAITPAQLRRNLVVTSINLHALRMRTFRIGAALLEGTGYCEPCSKMERALGIGGYNAVRGHGGITARVLEGALIRINDEVDFAE